jgi:murein DD-endopeptidase MepM/ murein hydrolase activator NlpD
MRALALLTMPAVAGLVAVLVPASSAQAPARASATATLLTGSLGAAGRVSAEGDAQRRRPGIAILRRTVTIQDGEVSVASAWAGGDGGAQAVAAARSVSLLDGLVTAYGVRRTATNAGAGTTREGRVAGLRIDGRRIGTVTGARSYDVDGRGTLTVNQGGAALRLVLRRAVAGLPAGTVIGVAEVSATARDGADPAATPTPAATPRPTATPDRRSPAKRARARERARLAAITRRLTSEGFAFPVYGDASVADDFGAARQIGSHRGNDVFAAFGAPVLAVADGTVEKVGTLPISGNRLWLRTGDGDAFFYAHLSAFAPDAVNGRRVRAGTVLGFTGNTGDAEPTPPHVHFEIHPGGADAIDPHAILTTWQERHDVAPGTWLARHGGDTAARPGALVEVRDFIEGD